MRLKRLSPLLAALALLAILGATTARMGHFHDEATERGQYTHCQLCLHLDRADGPAPERPAITAATLLASVERPHESIPHDCPAPTGTHLPRAPPLADYPLS